MEYVGIFVVIAIVVFVSFVTVLSRYKRCPSDRILVVYGKTGKNKDKKVFNLFILNL